MAERSARAARRDYLAVVVNRAERDARGWLKEFPQRYERTAFWGSLFLFAVLGITAIVIWSKLGLPAWIGMALAAAVILGALFEAAYRTWRDQEERLGASDGVRLSSEMHYVSTTPDPNDPDTYSVSFSRSNREGTEEITVGGKDCTPTAVRFDSPRSMLVKAADLPAEVRTRQGLRRYSLTIQSFVPGGFVLDSRECPPAMPSLACCIYFPAEASSAEPAPT